MVAVNQDVCICTAGSAQLPDLAASATAALLAGPTRAHGGGAPIRPLTDTTVPETEFPDPYNLGTALLVLRMQYTQDRHEMNTTLRAREPQATAARSKRVQQGATE